MSEKEGDGVSAYSVFKINQHGNLEFTDEYMDKLTRDAAHKANKITERVVLESLTDENLTKLAEVIYLESKKRGLA